MKRWYDFFRFCSFCKGLVDLKIWGTHRRLCWAKNCKNASTDGGTA